MATVAALPNSLYGKIDSLARRMALLRLLRVAAGTVLLLTLVAGLIILADAWLRFGLAMRLGFLAGWLVLAVAGIIKCVNALGRKADVDSLAALIENEYPNLAERLTSSVELAEAGTASHGSPTLISLLIRETEIRTSKLNFLQAAPEKSTYRRAGLAVGLFAAALLPAIVWPHAFATQTKRFFAPWVKAPLSYQVIAKPGDYAVARGQALTLSAYVEQTGNADSLPTSASLVMIDAAGKSVRLGMKADQANIFFIKLNAVPESFRYRVEAGEAVSREHEVTAVDLVQLVADSPAVTIAPPAYARKVLETKTIAGLGDFSALQYSTLTFVFRFDRPAQSATLEWIPQGDNVQPEQVKGVKRQLELLDGGTSARFETVARKHGRFVLTLDAGHDIRTELPPQSLNVITDRPPAFVKVAGVTEQMRAVQAYDTVPLDLALADDFGIDSAVVEYRVNEREPKIEEMKLDGLGTPLANGKHDLKIAGKAVEGDTFQFRLRITDNRRVPEAKLEPHVVYYPAENRWFTFKIARTAEPLKQQEILAQRDDIRKRLQELIELLKKDDRMVNKARDTARRQPKMSLEAAAFTQEARQFHQETERTLNDLAREIGLTPELASLANRLHEVDDQEMRNAADALQKAEKEKERLSPRDKEFDRAENEIQNAIKRIEGLQNENDRLAQQRQDQQRLEQLAERQQQLAEKTKQETDPQKLQDMQREQQQLAQELQRLTEQSPELKQALSQVQAEKDQQLADKARELAQAQRDLEQAMNQTQQEARKQQFAELAKQQRELAEKAAKLAEQTRSPVQAAQSKPLDTEKPKEAANALEKGDPDQALTKQEQTAQDLDRLGNDLDRALNLAKDPREAAKQLARLQDELKNRTTNEAKKTPPAQMPADKLNDLKKEQQAIQRAAESLSVPESNKEAQLDKQTAVHAATKAAEQLDKKNQTAAEDRMNQAKQALERLAQKLPSLEQRLAKAREEVAKLKQQQDGIARQAEQTIRTADQKESPEARRELAEKLADAARKQAEAADKLGSLDLPNHEARQEKTQDAMNKALQDMLSARAQDIPASQQEAKRQLERLEQALNGQKPVDEKAAELARKQQHLAQDAAKLAATPKGTPEQARTAQNLQNQQREVARDTAALQTPEAPQRKAEATQATQQAEQASREPNKADELAKKTAEAAKALQRLADQLNGNESDADRAARLARKQAETAEQTERLAKKPNAAESAAAKRQQQQIQDEAKQLRAGDEAAKEKQMANDALAQLSRTPPEKMAEAQRQAADALKNLADKLAKKQEQLAQETNQQPTLQQLAQQQRQLVQETQQGKQSAQQLAQKQQQLNQQAAQLPAGNQPKTLEQARQAMNQAEKSLAKGDNSAAQQKQQEAASALERMAQQQASAKPQPNPSAQVNQQPALASKGQVEQAKQLAQEQRDLRDAVQRAMGELAKQNADPKANPSTELAKEQQAIAQQAQQMAQQAAQQQGQQSAQARQAQQAAKAAQQTSNQLQNGQLQQAKQSGQQSAQELQRMAQNNKGEPAQQAGDLAKRQEAVNRQLEQLANSAQAQNAQQQARQQDLARQTQQLQQQMQQQANQSANPQSRNSMQQAAQQTQQAQQNMQQAQRSQQAGQPGQSQQAQQQAAQNLDRAAQMAQQAAQQSQQAAGQPQQGSPQQRTGQALQQAQNEMGEAQQHLGQNQRPQASQSMQQASRSLQQAAQSMPQQGQARPNSQTNSGNNDGSGQQAMDLSKYGPDGKKYQGKPWGELPGELRTRIIQDMKAQYGDDYSRMIKLYFEQLADKK